MRRLYAKRQEQLVRLCEAELGRWLTIAENDAGMQLLARFAMPFDDGEVVEAAPAAELPMAQRYFLF